MGGASRGPTYPTIPHMVSATPPSCRLRLRDRPAPASDLGLLCPRGTRLGPPAWRRGRGRRCGAVARPGTLHPALDEPDRRPADCERAGRHVAGHGRAGADVGVVGDADGRDQLRVAADLHARADARAVLLEAVVVAGDGSGADVAVRADLTVAEVGQVVRLGPGADRRLLGLDEVADVHALRSEEH